MVRYVFLSIDTPISNNKIKGDLYERGSVMLLLQQDIVSLARISHFISLATWIANVILLFCHQTNTCKMWLKLGMHSINCFVEDKVMLTSM